MTRKKTNGWPSFCVAVKWCLGQFVCSPYSVPFPSAGGRTVAADLVDSIVSLLTDGWRRTWLLRLLSVRSLVRVQPEKSVAQLVERIRTMFACSSIMSITNPCMVNEAVTSNCGFDSYRFSLFLQAYLPVVKNAVTSLEMKLNRIRLFSGITEKGFCNGTIECSS